MTDRLGFIIWPIIIALVITACATVRNIDTSLAGQPPAHLRGEIVTLVDWRSPSGVYARCAQLQASFGQFPSGAHGCAYAHPGGKITLVLPYDLHPLISHELGHAHQLRTGVPVDHRGWG